MSLPCDIILNEKIDEKYWMENNELEIRIEK
jgi:hypothetical protein